MPRKQQRTLSGAPAQPVAPTPGQAYGAGVDQMQMQAAMPAPQVAQMPTGAPSAPGAPPAGVPAPGQDPLQALLAAAGGLKDQTGLLTAPTARPNEPVTAGLGRGPGAGVGALTAPQGSPAGEMLRRLSQSTGDPYFAELARKANA